jgi:hypothetical protein
MLTKMKSALIIVALASSLSACAATTGPKGSMAGMKMDHAMCQKMMDGKECGCCKMMQNQDMMRTSGMMTGGNMKMMQCMPMQRTGVEKPSASTKQDKADHKAHHPAKY